MIIQCFGPIQILRNKKFNTSNVVCASVYYSFLNTDQNNVQIIPDNHWLILWHFGLLDYKIQSSVDPHRMNQSLVSLCVLIKDSSEHNLPSSFFFQLFHVLINELVLINKLENFLSCLIQNVVKPLLTSAYCFVIELIRNPPFLQILAIVCKLWRKMCHSKS